MCYVVFKEWWTIKNCWVCVYWDPLSCCSVLLFSFKVSKLLLQIIICIYIKYIKCRTIDWFKMIKIGHACSKRKQINNPCKGRVRQDRQVDNCQWKWGFVRNLCNMQTWRVPFSHHASYLYIPNSELKPIWVRIVL